MGFRSSAELVIRLLAFRRELTIDVVCKRLNELDCMDEIIELDELVLVRMSEVELRLIELTEEIVGIIEVANKLLVTLVKLAILSRRVLAVLF